MSNCDLLPPCIFSNTNKAECKLDKAKLFNKYFHSVCSHSSFNLPNMKDFPSYSNPITTIQFSVTEVYEALISLHPKKAAGVDDI